MHSRLIAHYRNIFSSQQLDDLNDVLTDDFYFRNPQLQILGKEEYIAYAKGNYTSFTTELIRSETISENEYVYEYYLTFIDSQFGTHDRLQILDRLKIKDGLICSSILEYKTDHISSVTEKILTMPTKKFGKALD